MAFARSELKRILSEHGIETVTSGLLKEICDLHTDTMNDVVEEKYVSKKDHEKVEKELQELKDKPIDKGVKVEESEEYKALQKKHDDFVAEIENGKKVESLNKIKKAQLEKLGIKGSALELLVKDANLSIEVDDKGEAKKESVEAFETKIKESYSDLIVTTQGGEGAGVPSGGASGAVDLDSMSMAEYAKYRKGEK